jgi:2-polyprenyl-3-methyl-5-hydroxy-6-metoxy-1,4-benzoquinol methylase
VKREDWDRRYAGHEHAHEHLWSAKPNRVLVAEVADLPPGRALDLACGEGQNAIWLAAEGWEVLGVDFSEVAIAKARARAAREGVDVRLLCADLLEYTPERAAYDLVLLFFLHLGVEERRTVLGRAAEALAPGGTLLLVGHDLQNIADGAGGPSDPSVLYTAGDVTADLPGLEIERTEQMFRDVEGEARPAIDVLVRARLNPSTSH